jgi:predicted CXXCH cytochrome family protein
MDLRANLKWVSPLVALLAALLWAATSFAAPAEARPTPHPTEGRSECLACHGPGTPSAVPADHAGRTNATCVACHPVAAAAPAAQSTSPASQTAQPAGKNDSCLGCHNNREMSFTLSDGTKVSAFVNPADYSASVHGSKNLACTDCHTNITGFPHPKAQEATRRDFSLAMDETCKKCHSDTYAKNMDGVHAKMIASGNQAAPGCTDCHGVHNISAPDQSLQTPSQMCAKCHQDTYGDYAASVHGEALLTESNDDVPDCIDCHGVHNMVDPRTAEFRVESPDLCAKCHANEPLMAEYGLSSKVVRTYKEEFHGVTTEQYKTRYPTVWCYKAVCTDCHGVHNIRRTDDSASSVHKSNLPETCGSCHPGASANFASAWIGHYEPSPNNSPLVYYVNLFYQIIIPVMILSLLAFIALDVFRRVMNNVRS